MSISVLFTTGKKGQQCTYRQNRLVTYKLQHYLYVAIKKDVTEINFLPRKDVHVHGYITEKAGYKISFLFKKKKPLIEKLYQQIATPKNSNYNVEVVGLWMVTVFHPPT